MYSYRLSGKWSNNNHLTNNHQQEQRSGMFSSKEQINAFLTLSAPLWNGWAWSQNDHKMWSEPPPSHNSSCSIEVMTGPYLSLSAAGGQWWMPLCKEKVKRVKPWLMTVLPLVGRGSGGSVRAAFINRGQLYHRMWHYRDQCGSKEDLHTYAHPMCGLTTAWKGIGVWL